MKDITEQRFGKLKAVCPAERSPGGKLKFKCLCDCGRTTVVFRDNLLKGNTKSCGKCILPYKDMAGKQSEKWFVDSFAYIKHRTAYWNCTCECGSKGVVSGTALRRKRSTSCGCHAREMLAKYRTKHGLHGTRAYANAIARRRLEKQKIHDSRWTPEMESLLRKVFDRCVVCGISEEEHKEKHGISLHVDHVLPLDTGNGLVPGNATILCRTHNYSKHTKTLDKLEPLTALKIKLSAELFQQIWDSPEIKYSYIGA